MAGAIAETAALGELAKDRINRGLDPRIFFWRTAAGVEVDFLVETARGLTAVEVNPIRLLVRQLRRVRDSDVPVAPRTSDLRLPVAVLLVRHPELPHGSV